MAILVMCTNPECGRMMNAPDGSAGREARCPECGTVQVIPGGQPKATPQPSAKDDNTDDLDQLKLAPIAPEAPVEEDDSGFPQPILMSDVDDEPEPPDVEDLPDPGQRPEAIDIRKDAGQRPEAINIHKDTEEQDEDEDDSPVESDNLFDLNDFDEHLATSAEDLTREGLGTGAGVMAVFGLGLLGSGAGFAAGLWCFGQGSLLCAYLGGAIGWAAGFILGMLGAAGMDETPNDNASVGHGPDMMLRNSLQAHRYQSSSFVGILVLVVFSFGAHMIGWMLWILTYQPLSGAWPTELRVTLAILGLGAEILFIGYAMNVFTEIVRNCASGGDEPPEVASINPLRSLLGAADTALLIALYILPVVTMPLLPFGMMLMARDGTLGAANMRDSLRAALQRPAQLAVVWLMLMLWGAIVTFACVILTWAGEMLVPSIGEPATHVSIMMAALGYAVMALLISALNAVPICAMFHCVGIFARENRDMLKSLSSQTTGQNFAFAAAGVAILAIAFGFLVLPAIRGFF